MADTSKLAILFEIRKSDKGEKLAAAIKALANNPSGLEDLEFYVNNHSDKWFEIFCKDLDSLIDELNTFAKHM